MDIVHVPQRRTLDRWSRLQRYFRFEGRLGGLRYGARFEIHELTPPEGPPPGREIEGGAERA
jgi:hypothetical protein